MRRFSGYLAWAAAVPALLCGQLSAAHAGSTPTVQVEKQLDRLAPEEELEQRCDIEAMNRIDKDNAKFDPDKVIAYAFGPTQVNGTTIKAKGAVFRSHEHWYRLSYTCETGAKRLTVEKFDYKIGSEVPRDQWDSHYLYD
ncbi:DUF930 domain-containing protein [Rhizobium sp. PAMB 3174]